VLVAIINVLLRLVHPRLALQAGELAVAYFLMLLANTLTGRGFSAQLLPVITGAFYYATPENEWRELILPHLPNWMMPHSPQTARLFYEGAGSGQPIPWAAWEPIFLAWLPFIWALFLVMIAAMVILRRQWIVNERLIFL